MPYGLIKFFLSIATIFLIISSMGQLFLLGNMEFGFTILAIGIAAFSLFLAFGSAEKMQAIANYHFLEIFHNFEDLRIQLTQHPDWLGVEGTVWKCKKYVDWTIELKKWAKKDYQNDLADMYIKLYQTSGVSWGNLIVSKTDIKHMITMSEDLSKFNINIENKDKLNEIKKDLQKILNKK